MKKLSGSKAIKLKCRECAGGSSKEVTLCHIFDCPLWQWRCGCHITSVVYKKRMQTAFKNNEQEWAELERLDIKRKDFLQ